VLFHEIISRLPTVHPLICSPKEVSFFGVAIVAVDAT
jgi:hypothetical protein